MVRQAAYGRHAVGHTQPSCRNTHAQVQAHMYTLMHIHTCTRTHAHTCIHACMHAHTRTRTCAKDVAGNCVLPPCVAILKN